MMTMLIRAGLPSRRAAMAAIQNAMPVFATPAEIRPWLESDEITASTDAGDWPTPDTAALWRASEPKLSAEASTNGWLNVINACWTLSTSHPLPSIGSSLTRGRTGVAGNP